MKKYLVLTFLLVGLVNRLSGEEMDRDSSREARKQANQTFEFQGRKIHPLIIDKCSGGWKGFPLPEPNKSIDIDGWTQGFEKDEYEEGKESASIDLPQLRPMGGYSQYERLGTNKNNVHTIKYISHSGGSIGELHELIFVKFHPASNSGRLEMVCAGGESLNRDYEKIDVLDDKVIVHIRKKIIPIP